MKLKLFKGPKRINKKNLKKAYTGKEGLLSFGEHKRINKHLRKYVN